MKIPQRPIPIYHPGIHNIHNPHTFTIKINQMSGTYTHTWTYIWDMHPFHRHIIHRSDPLIRTLKYIPIELLPPPLAPIAPLHDHRGALSVPLQFYDGSMETMWWVSESCTKGAWKGIFRPICAECWTIVSLPTWNGYFFYGKVVGKYSRPMEHLGDTLPCVFFLRFVAMKITDVYNVYSNSNQIVL